MDRTILTLLCEEDTPRQNQTADTCLEWSTEEYAPPHRRPDPLWPPTSSLFTADAEGLRPTDMRQHCLLCTIYKKDQRTLLLGLPETCRRSEYNIERSPTFCKEIQIRAFLNITGNFYESFKIIR
jgi:hypothetical protein